MLSDWGDGKGSIVVISHDKAFCEQIGFTHVLTITDEGRLRLEQRDANINDWDSSRQTYQKSTAGPSEIHDGDSDGAVIDMELDKIIAISEKSLFRGKIEVQLDF